MLKKIEYEAKNIEEVILDLADEIKILQEVRSTWEDTTALPMEESLIEYEREAEKACRSWLSMNPVMDGIA